MLYPAILMFCCIGLFSIHNDRIDVFIGAIFGLLGYGFSRMHCELAPMLLGFILGPLLEENLRRALLVSLGDPLVLLYRPISGTFLVLTLLLVVALALPGFQGFRKKAFVES
jgi:TctA family transporter